jgi:hypothetical protein
MEMNWKFWEDDIIEEDLVEVEDKFTKKDFIKSCAIFFLMLIVWGSLNLGWEKTKCAYTGHTYEKATKRPIFSECLIQMKDGSYVPLERYINRVLTLNDMSGVDK